MFLYEVIFVSYVYKGVVSVVAFGWWFFPLLKTNCHNITELLLKVPLITHNSIFSI